MRIKTKISAPVFLLVAFLMGMLTLAGYSYLAHALKQTVLRQHLSTLNMAAKYLDDDLLHSQEMLRLLAQSITPELLQDPKRLRARLDSVTGARTFFNGGFEVVDPEGRPLAQSPASSSGNELRKSDYVVLGFATGKPCISAPYLSHFPPHRPTVSFSMPILDAGGTQRALLAGHHLLGDSDPDRVLFALGSSRLFVMGRNRTVIKHPDPSLIMRRVPPGEDHGLDDALQQNRTAFAETTRADGTVWVTCATPLRTADWIVALQYPETEAYQPLRKARLFFAGALGAILLLAHLALRGLVQRVIKPLARLVEHLHALPSRRGEERLLTLGTGDELEHLAHAVNNMVRETDLRQATIEENRELYRIIADFTSELALLVNPDGSLRYISANCLSLTGYTDREFLENPRLLGETIHPEDAQHFRLGENCASPGTPCKPAEVRLVTRQGETRWFRYSCHEVTGADGEFLGYRGNFRDISQDRRLERMLEEERSFAESLLENTSTPLFVIDREHRIIVWNRAIAELTGMPASEMLGTDRQWEPFYREKRPTLCDVVLSGETEQQLELLYRSYSRDVVMKGMLRGEGWYSNLNGKDRYLFFDAAPVLRDGETVAVVETLYDITERARAEESLRLFSQVVEQSANAIMITAPDGAIQYVNRKFCEVSGYSMQEAVGQKPSIVKSGRHAEQTYRELWETITSGREWHGEFNNRRKNGSLYWESAFISPIIDPKGTLTHFIGIKEEITARKDAERKLLKNQAEMVLKHEQLTELFRQVEKGKREWEQTMDCVDDMVAMVDAQGRIRRCNRAFERITGVDYRKLGSLKWHDLLRGAGLDLDRLEGASGELYHEATRRWLTLKTYPYGDHGGSVIMLHDLTQIKQVSKQLSDAYLELKETHSQLLQQEKMASIGQLAAGVAHEINNPMGFISSNLGTMVKYLERLEGFLELQSAGVAETAPQKLLDELAEARRRFKVDYIMEDARNLLAESQDGAERVRGIVQNLKSFSRVDEAQATYVDLNDCLESTITIAWNELKYKTTLTRDYGELPGVRCLPQQLNQVFLNILVNAAHAIDKQGEIRIRTRHEGEQVSIAISDTGSGIPDEIKSRIFEPFFTTKEVGKGTGLGLSISYDIIKKHNGSIEVESSPGQGTTFIIRLPIEGIK